MELQGVAKASSDRARCIICGEKIGLGTPRVIFTNERFGSNSFACYKCGVVALNTEINDCKKQIIKMQKDKIEFKKLLKECKREIILANLEAKG